MKHTLAQQQSLDESLISQGSGKVGKGRVRESLSLAKDSTRSRNVGIFWLPFFFSFPDFQNSHQINMHFHLQQISGA